MKNVVKCYKDFFGYFNALKTHSVLSSNQDFESLNLVTAYSLIKYFNLLTKVIPKPGWHFQEERFLFKKGFKSLYCFSTTSYFQSKILIEL